MERVFQRCFKASHYLIIGHKGRNTITAAKVLLAVKTLKAGTAADCDEI